MSTPATETPQRVLDVSMTRVAVFIGHDADPGDEELAEPTGVELDYALQSSKELVAVVEDLKKEITKELHRRRLPGFKPRTTYTLCGSDAKPLDLQKTLDQLGIEDGDSLWLLPEAVTERHERVIERPSTAVARSADEQFQIVNADVARRMASWGTAALTGWTEIILARLWWETGSWIPAVASALIAAALIGAAWVATGSIDESRRQIADALGWTSVIALVAAAAMAIPGRPGGWHIAAGAGALVLAVILLELITGRYPAAVSFGVTAGLIVAAVAIAVAGLHMQPERIAVVLLTVVIALVTFAANIGGLFSGVPMPSFGSRQNREVYERAPGAPKKSVSPVPTGQIITGAQVAQWAKRGTLTATGTILAASVTLVLACRWSVVPGDWRFAFYTVGLCVVALVWSQSLIDRVQSVSLACAAVAGIAVVIGRYAAAPNPAAVGTTLLCAGLVAALAVAVLLAGLWMPEAKLKAPIRRVVMGLNLLLTVVLTVPWMLWLTNVYFTIRHLRH
ncbi:type VII secretion integral membrane protein EccD [Mycobacteroides abscessus]|uniref:type VII secretion integral membrane protein EccD n=1 Tax=Mycobacteroides abscessus TaxID=36809 RepID=UPI000928B0E5|nr:type VII secretion integral membrane protein EccD [Mycobacteroides abscessus]SIK92628.1 type VII secretion integral membrane protein EccD [Mycobacteroides abscessus subsp. abscessus]SIN02389.1 type VII secretion integral membrane protein EccD [Mycobacteroides abscessus subsp. abscessus]SIN10188.1 type VII secretion integral membrane protein EccD [Mycobacteroides abscessus subsp. abscessus]